jgi:hypothetical protein
VHRRGGGAAQPAPGSREASLAAASDAVLGALAPLAAAVLRAVDASEDTSAGIDPLMAPALGRLGELADLAPAHAGAGASAGAGAGAGAAPATSLSVQVFGPSATMRPHTDGSLITAVCVAPGDARLMLGAGSARTRERVPRSARWTVVLFAGHLLQVATAERVNALEHRVLPAPREEKPPPILTRHAAAAAAAGAGASSSSSSSSSASASAGAGRRLVFVLRVLPPLGEAVRPRAAAPGAAPGAAPAYSTFGEALASFREGGVSAMFSEGGDGDDDDGEEEEEEEDGDEDEADEAKRLAKEARSAPPPPPQAPKNHQPKRRAGGRTKQTARKMTD